MWTAAALLFLVHVAPGLQTPLFYYQSDVLGFGREAIGTLQTLGGLGVLAGAAIYGVACKHIPLRTSLIVGILLNAASTLGYLGYDSFRAAAAIDFSVSLLGTLSLLPLYDLAARAIPRGSESFGFGLMISIRNVALFAISDPVGARLYDQYHVGFKQLVWISAAATLVVLALLPLVPKPLLLADEQRSR
jgi:predicted MFS family arabinose efflux permease